MAELFGRAYKLTIDTEDRTTQFSEEKVDQSSTGGGLQQTNEPISTVNKTNAIVFSNLQIEANVQYSKSKTSTPSSPAKINIYNLSSSTLSKLKPEARVLLEAGYTDNLKPIYAGQIARITSYRRGEDTITTLVCNGMYVVRKNVRVAKSWPPGVTYRAVISDLLKEAEKYGITTSVIYTLPQKDVKSKPNGIVDRSSTKLSKGYAVDGKLIDLLTEICDKIDLKCYYDYDAIVIEPIEYSESLTIYEISKESIKNNITPYNDSSKSLSGSTTSKEGFEVVLPLSGEIKLSNKIQISTDKIKALCDVESISHSLSYYGDNWQTTLKLVKV